MSPADVKMSDKFSAVKLSYRPAQNHWQAFKRHHRDRAYRASINNQGSSLDYTKTLEDAKIPKEYILFMLLNLQTLPDVRCYFIHALCRKYCHANSFQSKLTFFPLCRKESNFCSICSYTLRPKMAPGINVATSSIVRSGRSPTKSLMMKLLTKSRRDTLEKISS